MLNQRKKVALATGDEAFKMNFAQLTQRDMSDVDSEEDDEGKKTIVRHTPPWRSQAVRHMIAEVDGQLLKQAGKPRYGPPSTRSLVHSADEDESDAETS